MFLIVHKSQRILIHQANKDQVEIYNIENGFELYEKSVKLNIALEEEANRRLSRCLSKQVYL